MKKWGRSINGKIRNATPVTIDGVNFKSKLEAYCYKKLKENNIEADYEPASFTILDSFKYNGKIVRKMSYTPDFVGKEFIIECKGFANESFPLRWKIFQYFLFLNKIEYDLYIPSNTEEVDDTINKILEKRKGK